MVIDRWLESMMINTGVESECQTSHGAYERMGGALMDGY